LAELGNAEPSTDYVSPQGETYDNLEIIFPQRPGPRPTTTDDEPHEQLNQLGPVELWDELHQRALALRGVHEDRSGYSFPETKALWLDPELAKGPPEAFIWKQEFAHLHPHPNSSWHLQLPWELTSLAISAGWAEIHPVVWLGVAPANSVMLYSPRNEEEMEVVWDLVEESHRFASGEPQKFVLEPREKS
jgi:phospholipase/carboxylesterase